MIWQDGSFRSIEDARVAPDDRGFTLADGVFETVRLQGGRARHVGRHLRRLRAAALFLRIPLQWSDDALAEVFASFARAAPHPTSAPGPTSAARLTLTRGPAPRGVLPTGTPRPTVIVTSASVTLTGDPVSVVLASWTRRNEHSPLSRIKSLSYGDAVLARLEAADRGADDALLRNTAGLVCAATAANLLLLRGDRLLTPLVEDGALPGIRRALLIERAGALEAEIADHVVATADAAFLSNSLGLREIGMLDGRPVPRRADVADRLRRLTEADD